MEIINLPKNKAECYLYHIRKPDDKGLLSEGYVGVSTNPNNRLKQHVREPNQNIKKLLNSGVTLECELITFGSKEEMYRFERYLRPEPLMGLNIARGGDSPPIGSHEGHKHSDKTKKQISLAKKGKCGGVNHPSYGKKASVETRNKQAQAKLGKRFNRKNVMCPHCFKNGGSNLMYRYHFDNCTHFMINGVFFDNITVAMLKTGLKENTIRTHCSSSNKPNWYTIKRNNLPALQAQNQNNDNQSGDENASE